MTDGDLDIEIPPQEVIPCESYEFPDNETSETESEVSIDDVEQEDTQEQSVKPPMNRAEKVMEALHVSHLTEEEKNCLFQWVSDFPDIFHLNGEQLTCTHLIQHRIPTIDDKVISKKSYRHPQTTAEEVRIQNNKQLSSGILKESKLLNVYSRKRLFITLVTKVVEYKKR